MAYVVETVPRPGERRVARRAQQAFARRAVKRSARDAPERFEQSKPFRTPGVLATLHEAEETREKLKASEPPESLEEGEIRDPPKHVTLVEAMSMDADCAKAAEHRAVDDLSVHGIACLIVRCYLHQRYGTPLPTNFTGTGEFAQLNRTEDLHERF